MPSIRLLVVAALAGRCAAGGSLQIRINVVGYVPDGPKLATVAVPSCGGNWSLVDMATGARPLRGTLAALPSASRAPPPCLANFSAITAPGVYKLSVQGVGHSPPFPVGPSALNRPFRMAMAGFYMARCGQATPPLPESDELVTVDSTGRPFAHEACHLEDGISDAKHTHAERTELIDATGGWHDAGDYGKYSVNTAFALGVLMYGWEHFSGRMQCADLGLPGGAPPVPDYLDEVRWGMSWLLKMQGPDGWVFHKLTGSHFEGFGELSDGDENKRFLSPVSSAATADLAATGAQCSRVFAQHDAALAAKCLAAARAAYAALVAQPEPVIPDLSAFNTGTYNNPSWQMDVGVRLWAAVELYATTREPPFLRDAEALMARFDAPPELCAQLSQPGLGGSCKVSTQFDWDDQRNFGAIRYLSLRLGARDKDLREPALVANATEQLRIVADLFARTSRDDAYGGPLGGFSKWGINGELARQSLLLYSAEQLLGANRTLQETALNTLSLLFGRNYWGRSFVTQLGDWPARHPHHRPSMVYAEAWPGLLVGGPNGGETSWSDGWLAFRSNEVAINWNAGLVYATARYYQCPSADPAARASARAPRPPRAQGVPPISNSDELMEEDMVWLGDPKKIHAALSQRERAALSLEQLTELIPPKGAGAEAAADGTSSHASTQRSRRERGSRPEEEMGIEGMLAAADGGGDGRGGRAEADAALQGLDGATVASEAQQHKRHNGRAEPHAEPTGAVIVEEPPAVAIELGRRGRQARGSTEPHVAPAEPVPTVDKSASGTGRTARKPRPAH